MKRCPIHTDGGDPCAWCEDALAEIRSWPARKHDYVGRERSRRVARRQRTSGAWGYRKKRRAA